MLGGLETMNQMTISIATAKPAELADFYSGVFGLKLTTQEESGVVLRTVALMAGVELCIVPDETVNSPIRGMAQIFHVTDPNTPQIIERAKQRGVDVKVSEDGKSAFLFDPAGQPWEIACP